VAFTKADDDYFKSVLTITGVIDAGKDATAGKYKCKLSDLESSTETDLVVRKGKTNSSKCILLA
jgi:hypothetical protein